MAKRKTTARRAAPRRAYRPAKKKRRTNTLNRSVKKPMQALGVAIGAVAIPYGAAMIQSVTSRSLQPISSAIMSVDKAKEAVKYGAIGMIAGTAIGAVADKTGLKKPINKVKRTIKSFTGGLI